MQAAYISSLAIVPDPLLSCLPAQSTSSSRGQTTVILMTGEGTCMDVRVVETTQYGPYPAVIPEVSGRAWITGRNEFYFDPADPLKGGFIFR